MQTSTPCSLRQPSFYSMEAPSQYSNQQSEEGSVRMPPNRIYRIMNTICFQVLFLMFIFADLLFFIVVEFVALKTFPHILVYWVLFCTTSIANLIIALDLWANGMQFFTASTAKPETLFCCITCDYTRPIHIAEVTISALITSWVIVNLIFGSTESLIYLGLVLGCLRLAVFASVFHKRVKDLVVSGGEKKGKKVLGRILGELFHVKEENIVIDALSGHINITKLEFNVEEWANLHLPFVIKNGFVDHIEVKVPVKTFIKKMVARQDQGSSSVEVSADGARRKPEREQVKVHVTNVLVVLAPRESTWEYDDVLRDRNLLIENLVKWGNLTGLLKRFVPANFRSDLIPHTFVDKQKQAFKHIIRGTITTDLDVCLKRVEIVLEAAGPPVVRDPISCGFGFSLFTASVSSSCVRCVHAVKSGTHPILGTQFSPERDACVNIDLANLMLYADSTTTYSSMSLRMARSHFSDRWSRNSVSSVQMQAHNHAYVLAPVQGFVHIPIREDSRKGTAHIQPVSFSVSRRQLNALRSAVMWINHWSLLNLSFLTRPAPLRDASSDLVVSHHARKWWHHAMRLVQLRLRSTTRQYSSWMEMRTISGWIKEYTHLREHQETMKFHQHDHLAFDPMIREARLRLPITYIIYYEAVVRHKMVQYINDFHKYGMEEVERESAISQAKHPLPLVPLEIELSPLHLSFKMLDGDFLVLHAKAIAEGEFRKQSRNAYQAAIVRLSEVIVLDADKPIVHIATTGTEKSSFCIHINFARMVDDCSSTVHVRIGHTEMLLASWVDRAKAFFYRVPEDFPLFFVFRKQPAVKFSRLAKTQRLVEKLLNVTNPQNKVDITTTVDAVSFTRYQPYSKYQTIIHQVMSYPFEVKVTRTCGRMAIASDRQEAYVSKGNMLKHGGTYKSVYETKDVAPSNII